MAQHHVSYCIITVELGNWINVIEIFSLFFALLCAQLALGGGTFSRDGFILAPKNQVCPDFAFGWDQQALTAIAQAVIKLWLAEVITSSWRHVGKVDRLTSARQRSVTSDAFLLHEVKQCELGVNVVFTADRL